jgi:cysteine desulfurase
MIFFKSKRLYLDNASGTPISKKIVQEMHPYFSDYFHNPSALYKEAVYVKRVISDCRSAIASELKSRDQEIYFIDGATEANNLALIGVVEAWQKNNPEKKPHIITSTIEHASILETCKFLEKKYKAAVSYISVDENGYINIQEFKKALVENNNTVLVSVGYVNGEIGTIQDIRGLMKIVRHHRKHNNSIYPYMHTDAVQAVNYVDNIGVPQLGIDLMTINASKIYGPKKSAVLYIKTGTAITALVSGGNQENGLRSGTENVPAIVGMKSSLLMARKLQHSEKERLLDLKDYFIAKLKKTFHEVIINAEKSDAIANIVNITFPNISHEEIMIRLDARGIMCSVKSACKAGEDGDSHVIRAIAKSYSCNRATGSIRFSMGRDTKKSHIDRVVRELKYIIKGMNETYKKYYQN